MEHKRKLAATASCEGGGLYAESIMIDRICDLPDQVAHHILSFLTITDFSRFGCVSKRCRELCLSTPFLKFDDFSFESQSTCTNRLRLLSCLDRFLMLRGDSKIHGFRVFWTSHHQEVDREQIPCHCEDDYFRVMTWVHNAVKCNVEVLDLYFSNINESHIPFSASIFRCESLRYLTVEICCGVLKAPSFDFSSNLISLEVNNSTVDREFFRWISCCCKCIKELNLKEVDAEVIIIESSSLGKINFVVDCMTDGVEISCEKVEEIVIEWRFGSPSIESLNIVAPNLKHFSWRGHLMKNWKLEKLELLEDAVLFLEPQVDDFDNTFEVLRCLCSVKGLTLNEPTIKALFREGSAPAQLHNVAFLGMNVGEFSDELVPAMVSLFRGMPNLCKLYIDYEPNLYEPKSNASAFDAGYWKMQNLAFIHKLKEVTIELSLGSNGVQLVKYVLEYAENLEKVFIIYLPQTLEDLTTKLGEFKIISNATVLFKKKLQVN